MKRILPLLLPISVFALAYAADPAPTPRLLRQLGPVAANQANPLVDYPGFLTLSETLGKDRDVNLVSEDDFIKMSKEPNTVILDARSTNRYEALHIKGAIHLTFTDFTEDALRKLIPKTDTRILIYCNNNFEGEPVNFASKSAKVALNIPTYINLHAYGYTNVKELKPLLDIKTTKIEFEGTDAKKERK